MVILVMNQTTKFKPAITAPIHELVTPNSSPDHGILNFGESEDGDGEQVIMSGTGSGHTTELFGRISMEDDQANNVGSAHWAAILDNVGLMSAQGSPFKEATQRIHDDWVLKFKT
ncbi:hypothetical protein ONS95_010028 [Cadophora gregata]|uniref:uncharacterized protein n=1 Tax=Cadophora gregata TaxID=51156 RepID=UPI0026DBE20A|nr:uncharacterized protein ONS95_010028 [Cadophora gregata]KAK0121742.1 hypothetical protein ONS95_010028 [Cadophora gregata]KAK0127218.1 hypothetical protein ONS96_006771 [Cadophora gregata f. sp. sojae]